MKRYLGLLILSLFFLLFASPVLAAENWVIDNFYSQINIQPDGKVMVKEKIDTNFGTNSKHGIYRDIPNIYYNQSNQQSSADIQVGEILQDGLPAKYVTSQEGNYLRLKIGDPKVLISRQRSYEIRYLVTGVLRSFDDHDELYWDITGNGWSVPISQISATVVLPYGDITKIACFQGVLNSTEPCTSKLVSSVQSSFKSTRPLQVSEGVTAVVGYTKNLVPILATTPPPSNVEPNISTPNLLAMLISAILGGGLIFWFWWKKGKEQTYGRETVMVEYSSPNNLRPAEIGTLIDEKADTLDVSATIIDLAARGFLTIKEEPKKWIFGHTDYILTKTTKDRSNLLSYEQELFDGIFNDSEIVNVSELKREFYNSLVKVKHAIYQDVIDKSFFNRSPESVKSKYTGYAVAVLFLGCIGTVAGIFESTGYLSGFGIGVAVTGILFMILSRSFSKRTPRGHEMFKRAQGFELFIEKAEKYKQQFLERENIFSEVLPYAIVFGVTEKFAQVFEDLGIEPPQPNWYHSDTVFNPVLFAHNINFFSYSFSTAISTQPVKNSFASSGSGFSGGFSGGGFGGGGGSSW